MADLTNWLYNTAAFLQSQSVGTLGSTMWIGAFPIAQKSGVLLIATGGFPGLKNPDTERPTAQITSRAATHQDAHAKATEIYELLHKAPQRVFNGSTRALYSRALQPPFQIAKTDSFFDIVCNYQFWLT